MSSLAGRRKRDIYGNWVWEEDNNPVESVEKTEQIKLDCRDVLALTIASLQTFLLPIVIFLVILFVLAVAFAHF
ncbi:MAG: hypothetical protein JRN15_02905 [Nitrososphaerota archaeon]|nr:hypothetical protein [Nitrososphaerota archaeon]